MMVLKNTKIIRVKILIYVLGIDIKPDDENKEETDGEELKSMSENDQLQDCHFDETDSTFSESSSVEQQDNEMLDNEPTDDDVQSLENNEPLTEMGDSHDISKEENDLKDEWDDGKDSNTKNAADDLARGLKSPENKEPIEQNGDIDMQDNDESKELHSENLGVLGEIGDQSAAGEESKDMNSAEDESKTNEMFSSGGTGTASKPYLEENGKCERQSKNLNEPNPHRSVGDATEKWQSRLKNIADSSEANNEVNPDLNHSMENPEFEYVQQDDVDQGETQALGVAEDDQIEQMNRKSLFNDNQEKEPEILNQKEIDTESEIRENIENTLDRQKFVNNRPQNLRENKSAILDGKKEAEEDHPSEKVEATDLCSKMETKNNEGSNMQGIQMSKEPGICLEECISKEYLVLRQELEIRMSEWRKCGRDSKVAQELWQNYINMTRDLAFSLCEQLRLILEPTLGIFVGNYTSYKT